MNGKDLDEVIDVLKELSPLRAAFPLLDKLIQLSLTIAVSSAHVQMLLLCFDAYQELPTIYYGTRSFSGPSYPLYKERHFQGSIS